MLFIGAFPLENYVKCVAELTTKSEPATVRGVLFGGEPGKEWILSKRNLNSSIIHGAFT